MRIIEVIRPARQGKTKPFICRARDKRLYYVKGVHAGYRSMICEWICGQLAQALELPIAPFEIVDVPRALVEGSMNQEYLQLGVGEAFGSREVEFAEDFQWNQTKSVDAGLATRVLVFDWWIGNSDRILGPIDGNVNLLWTNAPGKLHLIDHNNAFSQEVLNGSWSAFCADHVFGQSYQRTNHQKKFLLGPAQALEVAAEKDNRSAAKCLSFGEDCLDALEKLEEFWDEMPEKWQESCPNLSFRGVNAILDGPERSSWMI